MNMVGAASEGTLLDARHPNAGRANDVARTVWIAGALAPAVDGLWPHGWPADDRPRAGLADGQALHDSAPQDRALHDRALPSGGALPSTVVNGCPLPVAGLADPGLADPGLADPGLPPAALLAARSAAMAGLPAAPMPAGAMPAAPMPAGAMPAGAMPVPPAVAEQIILLFTILGWRPVPAGPARLALFLDGGGIRVVPDDPALVAPMAAAGLDRLVLPLSLAALEDLAALAG